MVGGSLAILSSEMDDTWSEVSLGSSGIGNCGDRWKSSNYKNLLLFATKRQQIYPAPESQFVRPVNCPNQEF